MEVTLSEEQIKDMLEEVVLKLLVDNKDMFREIIEEIIEDIALSKAIEEGKESEFVDEDKILEIIDNEVGV